ncbi:cc-nbs-lrr resistance protein [Corchorus capsularis]|uniref:Cc-nbs-lrr resistance protein n=1 Tax=Corchorus capsularis TaxID=210143 RepID=A0A1R3GWE6_COCAP|nr:cc-nbs-lrr resistance protein [Corchorus capsularis]
MRNIIEWPSLRNMDVYGCDKVEIFALEYPSSQETQGQSQVVIPIQQPLFWINEVTFPCLEELRLECNANMKEIWHGTLPEGYFKLKVLELIKFPAQETFLPSYFFQSLSSLENFVVSDASFLEIFQCEELGAEEHQERAFSKLRGLRLSKLHELTHLWKENFKPGAMMYSMQALEVQDCGKLKILVPSSVSFENLATLEVSRCQGLKYLVAYSTAKSMVHLTKMSIIDCKMMEEIIACSGDEVKEGIVFTQLKFLGLSCLPNLASFFSGNHTFKLPSLERVEYHSTEFLVLSDSSKLMEIRNWNPQGIFDFKNLKFLKVYKCRKLRYAFNPAMAMDLVHLQELEIHDCQMLEEVAFPSLEKLGFIDMESLRKICNHQFSIDSFSKLKVLTLMSLPKQSAVLPYSFFHSLSKLEKLVVDDASFTEIFPCGVGRNLQAWELTHFSDLRLSKLPELTHLWKEELQSQPGILFQNLRTLKVFECPKLKSLALSTVCFENLTTLEISRCHGFIHLITPSTAKSMEQLKRMRITDCKMIEDIIANGDEEWKDGIIFKKLEYLRLQSLPSLKVFCMECYHFEFPSLVEFIATECPMLSVFSKGETCTPLLRRVRLGGEENRPLEKQDLNITINELYRKKASTLFQSATRTQNDVKDLEFLEWKLSELWRPSSVE